MFRGAQPGRWRVWAIDRTSGKVSRAPGDDSFTFNETKIPSALFFPKGGLRIAPRFIAGFNLEEVASLSSGLPYSATLGDGRAEAELVIRCNADGVAAYRGGNHTAPPVSLLILVARGATPLGLAPGAVLRPKVAEYSNLGL